MADNIPPESKSGVVPPLASSTTTGRLAPPTTQLPLKKGGVGKIVVMLSSVAKPPPAGTQTIPRVAPLSESRPKLTPAVSVAGMNRPPPLPAKQVSPGTSHLPPPRLNMTTHVKLPQKTSIPPSSSFYGSPVAAPDEKKIILKSRPELPVLPAKSSEPLRSEPRKPGFQPIPPIKLNPPSSGESFSGESIFPSADVPDAAPKPMGGKNPTPGDVTQPMKGGSGPEVSARADSVLDVPKSEPPSAETKDEVPAPTPSPLPPAIPEASAPPTPENAPIVHPPPLPPMLKKDEPETAPPPLQVAPPLPDPEPKLTPEKLSPPHLPQDVHSGGASSNVPESVPVHQAPALTQPEAPPAKALSPVAPAPSKASGNWLKQSKPLILSSSSLKVQLPEIAEGKPALRSVVLPRRNRPPSPEPEVVKKTGPFIAAVPIVAASLPLETEATKPEAEKSEAALVPTVPPPEVPQVPGSEGPLPAAPLPVVRSERIRKRHRWETVIFYILFAVTILALFLGGLYFGRDTRVEGQVIPPPGMTLNNEVWIVTDFSSLAAGITEDLAKARAPIMQEIQERQDHVQRTEADVAAREERIRLIQEEMQASKDEIVALVKQSRDKTQQIWDGEGAQIDQEYTSRLNDLQKAIADRARSLKLKYDPDNSYQSPEVWANAYRLALYEVPASVDSAKEHQWLSDQMKQWRDFLKTLDDRKEKLREEAAQIKLAPASKITDLNTKIDELQQRSDGVAAEEIPLKAELQQADAELVQAQASVAGLDDKYYKELYALPAENNTKHIPLASNGRFTWVNDDVFAEGEKERRYWIFACATRADGRQYWALHHFSIAKNDTVELIMEPGGFVSTKAILRPDLSPQEQEQ